MIKKYEDFSDLVMNYADMFSGLSECQDAMCPKIFNKLVDSVFKAFNNDLKLYNVENNYRQAIKEEKKLSYLKAKKWKVRVKQIFEENNSLEDKSEEKEEKEVE